LETNLEKEIDMKRHKDEFDQTEDYVEQTGNATGSFLSGILLGGVIGAVTMLLFAPRSGEETRAEIRDRAIELRDRTTETVKDTVTQAKSKAYELKDNVWDKADEFKQRGQQALNQQLDRVSQAAETGKKKVQEY
jgi:gas vesicle protein